MFRKLLDQGQAGDNVGILLRGTSVKTSSAAKCWPSPAPSSPTHFTAEIYVLSKEGAAATPRSSTTTVRGSTSVPRT